MTRRYRAVSPTGMVREFQSVGERNRYVAITQGARRLTQRELERLLYQERHPEITRTRRGVGEEDW